MQEAIRLPPSPSLELGLESELRPELKLVTVSII